MLLLMFCFVLFCFFHNLKIIREEDEQIARVLKQIVRALEKKNIRFQQPKWLLSILTETMFYIF